MWVFHSGALGDHVIIWPMLRAMRRAGREVILVARASHAVLAASEMGVTGIDNEQARFTALWRPGGGGERVSGVARVLSFFADPATQAGRAWVASAAAMFPGATVECIGPPGTESRRAIWRSVGADTLGRVEARSNPAGPIVLHVGAGSRAKRWAVERWVELAVRLRAGDRAAILLAGHVEREQFTPAESASFRQNGGRFIEDELPSLAAALRSARLVVASDSGPAHLAAQMGVPTVALFGPTNPAVWAPVGARVRVVAPERATADMAWLSADTVGAACDADTGAERPG